MSLDLLGSHVALIVNESSLGIVREGASTSKFIYVYTFIDLYTIDSHFSELLDVEWLSYATRQCYHI